MARLYLFLCYFTTITTNFVLTVAANRACPRLSLSHGDVICRAGNNHQSTCSFICNNSYSLIRSPTSVTCQNGTWKKGRSKENFGFEAKCVSSSLRRSFRQDVMCSDSPCEGTYHGITQQDCKATGRCCWNKTRMQCMGVQRRACALGYHGIPEYECRRRSCVYVDNKCYEESAQLIPSSAIPSAQGRAFGRSSGERGPPCIPRYTPQHSHVQCAKRTNTYHCQVFCDQGYYLVGESHYTCHISHLNFSIDWRCKAEIHCPTLDSEFLGNRHRVPKNAVVNCTKGCKVGSLCEVICPRNYRKLENVQLRCESDGKWQAGTFHCEELPKCRRLVDAWPNAGTQVSNGQLKINCTRGEYVGSICRFSCAKNHRVIGRAVTRCKVDLNWNERPPTCRRIARTTSTGCKHEVNMRSGRSSPQRNVGYVQVGNAFTRRPRDRMNACNMRGSIVVDFTRLQTLTLRLKYRRPTGSHLEIYGRNTPRLLKGFSSYLYYGFYPIMRLQGTAEVTVQISKLAINVNQGRANRSIRIPTLASESKIYVHLNKHYSRVGSGLCNVCTSYVET